MKHVSSASASRLIKKSPSSVALDENWGSWKLIRKVTFLEIVTPSSFLSVLSNKIASVHIIQEEKILKQKKNTFIFLPWFHSMPWTWDTSWGTKRITGQCLQCETRSKTIFKNKIGKVCNVIMKISTNEVSRTYLCSKSWIALIVFTYEEYQEALRQSEGKQGTLRWWQPFLVSFTDFCWSLVSFTIFFL